MTLLPLVYIWESDCKEKRERERGRERATGMWENCVKWCGVIIHVLILLLPLLHESGSFYTIRGYNHYQLKLAANDGFALWEDSWCNTKVYRYHYNG